MTVRTHRNWLEASLAFLLAAALLVVAPGSVPEARADILTVDGAGACSDVPGSSLYCTIDYAISDAVGGVDLIEVADGTYSENLFVDRDITIEAINPGLVTVDGGGVGRVINVSGTPTVTLRGLRLTGGSAASGAGVNVAGATFNIENSEIEGNTAAGNGGGIFVGSGVANLDQVSIHGNLADRGAGIYNGSGTVDLFSSTVSLNSSTQEGGAVYQQLGTTVLQNVTFTGNGASTGVFFIGGGSATLRNTVAAGNTAGSSNPVCNGGGTITSLGSNFISRIGTVCSLIFTQPGDITGTPADPADPRLGPLQDNGGVGLSHEPESDSPLLDAGDNTDLDLTLDQLGNARTVDGIADGVNTADIGAVELDPVTVCAVDCDYTAIEGGAQLAAGIGGLSNIIRLGSETYAAEFLRGNKNLIFQGSGRDSTIVDASGGTRVAQARGGAIVTIRDMTLTGANRPGSSGAGVSIFEAGSDLTLERVRVTGNTAGVDGAGVENSQSVTIIDSLIDGNSAGQFGGGVYTFSSGATVIQNTTITGNAAGTEGGGSFTNGGTVSIVNSTITGNTVTSGNGGAVAVAAGATTVNNSTLWDNSASAAAQSAYQSGAGTVTVANSILGEPELGQNVCGGTVGSADNNILTNADGCGFTPLASDQTGSTGSEIDPLLGALADNGGPTRTLGLLPLSPAIDAGNNATCELTDQRGLTRIVGSACDIGAFEVQAPATLQALIDATDAGDTVNVPDGTYNENIIINKNLTVLPVTPGAVTIDGGGSGTTVTVNGSATVAISDLTITGGGDSGLRLESDTDVTLTNVDVVGNTTASAGGGIDNFGTLNVFGGSISSNTSTGVIGGGLVNGGTATLDGVTMAGNGAGGGDGGAAYNAGLLNITNNSVLSGNTAGGGAAIYNNSVLNVADSLFTDNGGSAGGAIYNGGGSVVTLVNTDFTDNYASTGGGAIWNNGVSVDITGGQFLRNHAGPLARAGAIDSSQGGTLTIDGTDFTRNGARFGGALYLVDDTTITGATFEGNVAGFRSNEDGRGGAIAAGTGESGQVVDIATTAFTNNAASRSFTTPVVDQQNLFTSASADGCGAIGGSLFQGFVPATTQLDFVRMRLSTGFAGGIGPGGLTAGVRIREGGPQGAVLASAEGFVEGPATAGFPIVQANLAVPLSLVAGNLYVIEVHDMGLALWVKNDANPYPDSQAWVACGGGGGAPLSLPGTDYEFATGSATLDGTWDGGAIDTATGTMTIVDSTFTSNVSSDTGGALRSLDTELGISGSVFTGNVADTAGGAVYGSGNFTISTSSFAQNTSDVSGGAISSTAGVLDVVDSSFEANSSKRGGAIGGDGEINVAGSTFVDNTADNLGRAGGAIYFSGGGNLSNSTVSSNTTGAGASGGGVAVEVEPVTINNSTIADNSADLTAGGIASAAGLTQVSNSIVADNTVALLGGGNCAGVTSLGYNVFTDTTCNEVASDQVVADALLGPLQDNGGPTQTRALQPGSPAVDGGDPGTLAVNLDLFLAGGYLQFNGAADAGGAGVAVVSGEFQTGSAYATTTEGVAWDLDTSFSTTFEFQITDPVPWASNPSEISGDGLTFAISPNRFALGEAGGRIGAATTPGPLGVLSVEFDTYFNGGDAGTNHVGINLQGVGDGQRVVSDVQAAVPGAFDDGSVWTAWVDYSTDTNNLEVRVASDGVRPATANLSYVVDIADVVGPTGYYGFTAATGLAYATHTVTEWDLETQSCAATDQRGVLRPVGAACDVGAFELDLLPDVSLALNSDPVVDSGASTIATTSLPAELATAPTDPTDPTDDNIGSAPIANLDTQSTEAESSPIANLPIANLEVGGAPIANLPIANLAPAAQEIVDAILLIDVPLEGGWEVHLAASPTLTGRPIQSVTFGEAMADPDVLASLEAAGLTFNDMNLSSTPIANLTIAGLALGNLPIANLPIANLAPGAPTADILQAWCDALAQQPVNCTTIGIDPNPPTPDDGGHSLASLSIAGADLSTLPIANIPIANLDTESAPIANLPIANLPIANLVLTDSPIANLPIANLPIANLDPSGLPIANLPIANLPIANLEVGQAPIANLPIANLPIANLELTDSPIANIPIANLHVDGAPIANLPIANLPIANLGPDGLPIANLPIANLPIANLPIANIPIANLVVCNQPALFDCNNPEQTTVGELYLLGLLQGDVSDWAPFLSIADLLALSVADAAGALITIEQFTEAFVGSTLQDLIDPPTGQSPNLGEITLSQLADFLGMTLGELIVALIQSGIEFELGDVLLLLVNPEDYPWEDLNLDGVDLQQFDTSTVPTVFSAVVDVTDGLAAPGEVVVTLPDGFLFTGVDVTGPGGAVVPYTFAVSGQSVTVNLAATPDGVTTVDVESAASLSVGAAAAASSVTVGATAAIEDTLYVTHIAEQDDVDMYKIENVQPGDRISVILSDMAEDFDLVLYQPELPPLRPGGVTPEGIATGVTDPGGFVDGDEQIQNEVSGDFPRATFNDGTQLRLYETSTQQGTSDEVITTGALQANGTYYAQVHGNNGATSSDPYVLRVEKIESATSLQCDPLVKPFAGQGNGGTVFPATPNAPNALFLYNEQRLGDFYGSAAADDVRDELHDLALHAALGVNGIVVPVESDPDVAAAYAAWDSDRCNPLAANAVAAQIGQLVDDYRALYPTIESITVVGDDGQIPFFRVPDYTEIANENEYALSISPQNNELVGSLLAGFVLTDDPYGDAHPLLIDGRELYISELPMGRLVETPGQILQSLGHFVEFSGRLDPGTTSTGLSTGYDFIEDGANAIRDALDTDPRRTTTTLNSDNAGPLWDSQALSDTIDSLGADVLSLGAHMAHDGLLSALEDTAGTQADLYEPIDAQNQITDILKGRIIFSMGCHSGLSVSDVQVGGATPDWAETFSDLGAVYAAETGFGYGDTEIVAYGEELMRQFSVRLNGSMTIGEAMQFAKQFHAANVSQYSPYDEKVIMETVVYGLPFYNVGDPQNPPPAPPILPTSTDPATGLTVVSTSFDYGDGAPGPDGQFLLESGGDRGDYYTAAGEAQATAFNPIQPKATKNVTQPGLVGTGVFISELTSVDKPNFTPAFSRPTVDLAAREPELSLPGTFPLVLPGINTYLDYDGERSQLVVVLGQFTDTDDVGEVGTERLFTHVQANVLYGNPADLLVPTIRSVKAIDTGTLLTFNVDAYDQNGTTAGIADVARVNVLYKLVGTDGAWSQLDLANVGDRWVGAVPSLGAKVEYMVQAVDFNGLVAYHSNKTAGNESTDAPPPQPGGVEIEVNDGPAVPVYTTDPVTIEVVGADEGAPVEIDVDGAGFEPYEGAIDVSGEGPHVVTVDDGSGAPPEVVVFVIDTAAPEIFINSPVDGGLYAVGSSLDALYSCTDAGSGATSCSGQIAPGGPVGSGSPIDTSAFGVFTLEVSSTDALGRTSSQSVTFELVFDSGPAVDISNPVDGAVYRAGTDLVASFSCTPDIFPMSSCTGLVGMTGLADGGLIDTSVLGLHTLEVTGTNSQGISTTEAVTFEVVALDVAPTLAAIGADVAATAEYDSIAISDSITIDWGDGSTSSCVAGDNLCSLVFAYAEPGVYTVTATVGGDPARTVRSDFVVIYDPSAGFVTGGGWFDSPVGALASDPLSSGRAEFGFVSKYKKGAEVPTGNTAFELVTEDFEFSSTSYQWLVVSGAAAQYQGVGVIEGLTGEYKFKVTVRDADVNENDAHVDDAFRIKIWAEDTTGGETVFYDNGLGAGDTDEEAGTQPIGGGSIVIHVPKGGGKGPR